MFAREPKKNQVYNSHHYLEPLDKGLIPTARYMPPKQEIQRVMLTRRIFPETWQYIEIPGNLF